MSGPELEINTLIEIDIPDGPQLPSRVEDSDGSILTLAGPPSLLEPPEPGDPIRLLWSAGLRGRYVAPVELVEIVKGTLPLWRVKLAGETSIEQRRRFARVPVPVPEPVQLRGKPADKDIQGRIIDISEGGLRCRLDEDALEEGVLVDDALGEGQAVSISTRLDDHALSARGRVLRIFRGQSSKDLELVITMHLDENDAGFVRRYVMREQIRARRAAADDY
jgi:hypothetical protein